jgi:uncharacterized cofD-like protein
MDANDRPKVVTIGGGHGQATLLSALRPLPCEITAIVSVADDGGCSGKLRRDLGMPPPGDLRRCLSTLARDRSLAEKFELRLFEPGQEGRSAGNLALSEAFREYGSLQKAVDWAADLLHCAGRVVPVAESPGVLVVYDLCDGRIEGETHVEHVSSPMAAMVHGPTQTNPIAFAAMRDADYILMGPGSFFTSTLATVTTANVAESLVQARAPKVLIANLTDEGEQTKGFVVQDYVRLLRDHLTIASIGGDVELSVLMHGDQSDEVSVLPDGTPCMVARVALPGEKVHDPVLLSGALVRLLGLPPRVQPGSIPPPSSDAGVKAFQERLTAARKRLRGE